MILGADRDKVIENIRLAVESGDFYRKVEPNDPHLSTDEQKKIVDRFVSGREGRVRRLKTMMACGIADVAAGVINRDTEICVSDGLTLPDGGAIVTVNHFSPLENTAIRYYLKKTAHKKLSIVSQASNFAMGGVLGFLMNYANTIPLAYDPRYISGQLTDILSENLGRGEYVLIYPEQEMWFNYRKPRPPKDGAYYFAAKLHVPVVSCFTEIVDTDVPDTDDFYKVRYVLHVLDVLYPDPAKSDRQNRVEMCSRDFELKKQMYEQVYGKPLSYSFEDSDIAGWVCREG